MTGDAPRPENIAKAIGHSDKTYQIRDRPLFNTNPIDNHFTAGRACSNHPVTRRQ